MNYNQALTTAEAIYAGKLTARESIAKALQSCRSANEELNAFAYIAGNHALERAEEIDLRVKAGENLPLAGVPLAVKDDFMYSGMPASMGSEAFKDFVPPFSAAAVDRLIEAGAVVVGKTNLGDLGAGSTRQNVLNRPVLNPYLKDQAVDSAGAAALAAGQCLLSLESDCGGALRRGASQCGVFGLRPTLGRVSRHGLHMACSSFGQAGLCGLSIADVKAALQIISGSDQRDAATAAYQDNVPGNDRDINRDDVTIGLLGLDSGFLSSEEKKALDQALVILESKGYRVVELEFDLFEAALRAYYIIAYAETSSNLSRFDGIRFGKAAKASNLDQLYTASRAMTLGIEARRRSILGTYFLVGDNFNLYYRQALKVWRMVKERFNKYFEQCSFILMPLGAFANRAGMEHDALSFTELCEGDMFCVPASMCGLPSLSLPIDKFDGLPAGVQLVGPAFSEEFLLEIVSFIKPELDNPSSEVL